MVPEFHAKTIGVAIKKYIFTESMSISEMVFGFSSLCFLHL